jgi:hypothetical protein
MKEWNNRFNAQRVSEEITAICQGHFEANMDEDGNVDIQKLLMVLCMEDVGLSIVMRFFANRDYGMDLKDLNDGQLLFVSKEKIPPKILDERRRLRTEVHRLLRADVRTDYQMKNVTKELSVLEQQIRSLPMYFHVWK